MPLIETQPDAVAITYANALFDMVKGDQAAVERTLAELEGVMELARADRKFNEFLASRIIPAEQRSASLDRMLSGRLSPTTVRFLQVLNDKGRLHVLPAIVQSFDSTVQKHFGRVEVDVYTAAPMEPAWLDQLARDLQARLGRQPVLHPYVDPTMLGGIRIQIGDQLVDASVSGRLAQIREQINTRGSAAIRAAAERLFRADPSSNGH